MNRRSLLVSFTSLAILCFSAETIHGQPFVQETTQPPSEKGAQKPASPGAPENPAQIELLETRVRFETDGSSRKEVHARVRIHSELGVRQFARLNFDYNRAFENVEIPFVHITHASGGTVDILPSAITDNPHPAVVNAPAYQDVRVKSVRILGLAPGDTLEYRVITAVSHHPFAPDFWLDHSFDRTGVVTQEIFELDLPASRFEAPVPNSHPVTPSDPLGIGPPYNQQFSPIFEGVRRSPKPGRVYVSPETPATSRDRLAQEDSARLLYKWNLSPQELQKSRGDLPSSGTEKPDVIVSTLASWSDLAIAMGGAHTVVRSTSELLKLQEMAGPFSHPLDARSVYELISRKIRTIDLPFDTGMGLPHDPFSTLSNGYGTAYAKAVLFEELTAMFRFKPRRLFLSTANSPEDQPPRLTAFSRLLLEFGDHTQSTFLDPSMEVAPFGLISANLRGAKAMRFTPCAFDESHCWMTIPKDPPFPSKQRVGVNASVGPDGTLTAKVKYSMRGDNELLLRVALHQAPKEKWKDLAQLLALSDGFRGKVTSVTASDPSATREPFTLDYEITTPQFVDWSKKPVRIPALLPQIGLPDPPAKPSPGASAPPIELGTPLEVETQMTLHLPPGTSVRPPTGTSVQRDYATFASQYSAKGPTITASRHINFLLREIAADRAADYNAFLHAVQNDEAQDFTLNREDPGKVEKKPDAPKTPAVPHAVPPKP